MTSFRDRTASGLLEGSGFRIAVLLAVAAVVVHAFAALRYGYYRDELYFIACARHLAWGYPDQPPLVAIAAWLSAPMGYALIALRALPVLAAGGAVFCTCLVAHELGGRSRGVALAGIASLLLPTNLFLGSTLTTTSFEPFTWTLATYIVIRIAREASPRLWYALAVLTAFALYAKYSIALLLAALAVGLLLSPQRRVLADPRLAVAAIVAFVLVLPNFVWQGVHGWAFLQVLHGDVAGRTAFNSGVAFESANLARNAVLFLGEQLLFTNPFIVPVWLAGTIALFAYAPFARARFVGVAFVVLLIACLFLAAKGYYIAGIYPALTAAGAVWFASLRVQWPFGFAAVVAIAGGIALAPLFTPLISVRTLIGYQAMLGFPPARQNPPLLFQPLFAEEFGWDELAQHVARVYASLPRSQRARTAIFADTYGDAAALDVYGPRYGLPPAISGQNAYYLWGTRGYDGSSMIAVGASQSVILHASFRRVRMVETYLDPYRWSAEGPTPIFLCSDPVEPLARLWPRFKWYGA